MTDAAQQAPVVDAAALATEYLDLKERASIIDDRVKQIQAALRTLGAGKHAAGDFTITITTSKRFNTDRAHQVLGDNPTLLAACIEETISSSRAKKVLPPAIYDMCMVEVGDPRVTIR